MLTTPSFVPRVNRPPYGPAHGIQADHRESPLPGEQPIPEQPPSPGTPPIPSDPPVVPPSPVA